MVDQHRRPLSDATTVTVGASYQNENNDVAWNGLPSAANGADLHLPRSRSFAGDWEYWDKKTRTLFVDIEHRLDNDWKLRLAGSKAGPIRITWAPILAGSRPT